jgi:hypothetical protein
MIWESILFLLAFEASFSAVQGRLSCADDGRGSDLAAATTTGGLAEGLTLALAVATVATVGLHQCHRRLLPAALR